MKTYVKLIAISLALATAAPALAQDNGRSREDRREQREDRREQREERRDDRQDNRRDERRDDWREERQERRGERREERHERREDRREFRQDRREHRLQAERYRQLYQQRLREQQRRWAAYRYDNRRYVGSSHRYRLGNRYWTTDRHGIELIRQAANHGYAEGIRAGRADRYDRWRFDYRDAMAYRDGSYGYNGRYIRRDHYTHYFREGFRRGYEDGYHGRAQYGRQDNGQYLMIAAILSAIIGR